MTPEERELDAAVAKEVLKLGRVVQGKDYEGSVGPLGFMRPPEPEEWYYCNTKFITHTGTWTIMDYLPYYSTHIYAAWHVVEKMYELGYSYAVAGVPAANDHQCRFTLYGRLGPVVRAATAPLAICRAALAALEQANGH